MSPEARAVQSLLIATALSVAGYLIVFVLTLPVFAFIGLMKIVLPQFIITSGRKR